MTGSGFKYIDDFGLDLAGVRFYNEFIFAASGVVMVCVYGAGV